MNTAQFISIFNSGGNPLGPFQERVAADGGTVEGLDNMLAKYDASASWQLIPSAVKAGTAYAQVPNTSLGDLTVTRASSGTFTNSAGVVQTAASNVLRTDYRNADGTLSATGRYLLEPQRTNLTLWSEDFTNAAYAKTNATVVANTTTAPDNTTSADSLVETATNGFHLISRGGFPVGTNTLSIYAKANTRNFIYIAFFNGTSDFGAYFNLSNGTIGTIDAGITAVIQPAGNGFYRCSVTLTSAAATTLSIGIAQANGTRIYTGNGTSGVFIWGAQVEAGAYATSYIPTTTAAVTRLADTASKTGVSSLIGQTEGTLYAEFFSTSNSNSDVIQLQATTAIDNIVAIGCGSGSIFGVVYANGGYRFQPVISRTIPGEKFKVALCYKTNDFTFFINGVKVASGTSNYTPLAPLTKVLLNETTLFGRQGINYDNAIIIATKLTDQAAIQLTTL